MSFNSQAIKAFLKKGEIKKLFIEGLGWDAGQAAKDCEVQGTTYSLKVVASKAGFKVWHCELPGQNLPSRDEMKTVHRQLVKESYEHIIIFSSKDSKSQAWLWVRREANKPISYKHHLFNVSQEGESLTQKLRALYITFEEEESGVNIVDVTKRAKTAFDVEKVTKKFYQEFDKHRKVFLGFIDGIPVESDREWYASVMLNRLMFAYFIQKKGFLDSNPDYLKSKLKECQAKKGEDKFYSFYRLFLLRLFHEGLGMKKLNRPKGLEALLGNIPYLNGGMFDVHELEHPDRYGKTIEIKDEAFEKVFAYFDQYQWHLDERPLKNDKEINPDVLGYIFEKYINQKQMGAYYTKEDITEYISKSTIIPSIFESAKNKYSRPFESENSPVWNLLKDNPDDYIYKALSHGADIPLPDFVMLGFDVSKPDLAKRRDGWNRVASEEFALPTETWREVIARRQRYNDLRVKLESGDVRSIDSIVSLNLDIRQFATEVIDGSDDPELIWNIWESVSKISILDPTGGSGAFLFAALNILEPIYEACIDRMDALFREIKEHPRMTSFNQLKLNVDAHSNRKYFILKSIILNNLYAVDIMEEAVEICKLRLFLKLASQVEPDREKENYGIEPLPDIDFNICSGNALVGYATYEEVKNAITSGLDFEDAMTNISSKAGDLQQAFDKFRKLQTDGDGTQITAHKGSLLAKLKALEVELNIHLANESGVNVKDKNQFSTWEKSHQPFHWFIQFYGILSSGGFDVIIGNPPYVEYKDVKKVYKIKGYITEDCGNLYAYTCERCVSLANKRGRNGLIIPVASVCTDGYGPLRDVWLSAGSIVVSSFNDRPGKLFDGLEHIRLCIVLLSKSESAVHSIHSSAYNKWATEAREHIFKTLSYTDTTSFRRSGSIPKIGSFIESDILKKTAAYKQLQNYVLEKGANCIFYTRKLSWFVQILDFVPGMKDARGRSREPSELKEIYFFNEKHRNAYLCVLNSSYFYWLLTVWSDCRNLNRREILSVPFDVEKADASTLKKLDVLADLLMQDLRKNSREIEMNYKEWGAMKIQCIYPKHSKNLIDRIDEVLASYFGLNEEELDFIKNYEIKFRLGRMTDDEEGFN